MILFLKIGSFNCDLTSCKDGYANWRQTEGEFWKNKKLNQILIVLSGCWKILDGNKWERVTEKEYAVNEGKVSKDKDKAKDKDKDKDI